MKMAGRTLDGVVAFAWLASPSQRLGGGRTTTSSPTTTEREAEASRSLNQSDGHGLPAQSPRSFKCVDGQLLRALR